MVVTGSSHLPVITALLGLLGLTQEDTKDQCERLGNHLCHLLKPHNLFKETGPFTFQKNKK